MPSAAGYWVEYSVSSGGTIHHRSGGSWSLEGFGARAERTYSGESCSIWVVQPPGLNLRFLVFDAPVGAYTMKRVIFHERHPGDLTRCGEILTVGEIQGDSEQQVLDATFDDLDGDGKEELVELCREWVSDQGGRLVANWALREVAHKWDGDQFRPRRTRIRVTDQPSPFVELVQPASSASASLTHDQAIGVVWNLPEVVRWRKLLGKTKGEVRPIAYAELKPADGIDGWILYVGEDHDTHTALKDRYLVRERTREVLVWDGATDRFKRRSSKP